MRCDPCSRVWRGTLPPDPPAAVVRWTGPNATVSFLCLASFDAWLDNADDDPSLEPLAVQWLPPMPEHTVEDQLAFTIGALLDQGAHPLAIAEVLLRTGWQPPPVLTELPMHR